MFNREPKSHNTFFPREPSMFNQEKTRHRPYFNHALMNGITLECQPYIPHIENVEGDVNCGFWAIVISIGFGEDYWLQIRLDLRKKVLSHLIKYKNIFSDNELFSLNQSLNFYESPAIGCWFSNC